MAASPFAAELIATAVRYLSNVIIPVRNESAGARHLMDLPHHKASFWIIQLLYVLFLLAFDFQGESSLFTTKRTQ